MMSPKDADQRRDALALRMLKMPPKHHDEMRVGKPKQKSRKSPAKARVSASAKR
jgi:hypothetical protein